MKFWALRVMLSWSICCTFEEVLADVFQDGQPVVHERFSFIVSLQEWRERWEHICVGNVVDQRNVLTACQCVGRVMNDSLERKDVKKLRVFAGAGNLQRGSILEQYVGVRNFTAHPRVSAGANGTVAFDLAMLHLSRALEFNMENLPMNLPTADTAVHSKALCYSPGWGRRWGQDDPSENLTLAEYRRLPTRQCHNVLCRLFAMCSTDLEKYEQICASNPRLTSCFTDLGSPLVCNNTVYGVASFNAGPNAPIIFTGLKPILEMVRGFEVCPLNQKVVKKVENDTERQERALEERKRLEQWLRMLSASQTHQAASVVMEFLLVLTLVSSSA